MENEPPLPQILIGTCAWSFEQWRGIFYPQGLPQSHWLEFYSRHFGAVEIDSTFYHVPTAHAVRGWFDRTPEDFTFTCKLPRQITHEARLRDAQALLNEFLETMDLLRPRLSCVLIQLPHAFSPERDEAALKDFVLHLPPRPRFAIEFRHPGWHTPRIIGFLEEHRVCWVWSDMSSLADQNLGPFEFLPVTTDFLYIRLMGDLSTKYQKDGSLIHRYGSLMWPREPALESWAVKVRAHLEQCSRVHIFANNHFEGFSPLTCQRLARRLGISLQLPPPEAPSPEPEPDPQLSLL